MITVATLTPISTNKTIMIVSMPALIPILLINTALSKSVAMQKSKAPVTPNFLKSHTITIMRRIANSEPRNTVLYKGKSEFLQIIKIIPAVLGQTIKKENAMLVINNPFSFGAT